MTSLEGPSGSTATVGTRLDSFSYDDAIVRKFLWATFIWGLVGCTVGLIIALQLAWPAADLAPWFAFGRLRPLHTNAVIFAFAGNAFFTGLLLLARSGCCKARMFSDALSNFHFWGWQAIIVAAAITLPLRLHPGQGVRGTRVADRHRDRGRVGGRSRSTSSARSRSGASGISTSRSGSTSPASSPSRILHIFNNLSIPAGPLKSYSIYAGVQDAFMQWWYGHNAVAFFLTTPFLGLMYYFMPKAAERPVYSYKLSILHFWSLVFMYIWAGPHHLHYTALPEWASTLGMVFSVMLWMPSWGGMINGLLTLRGAWHKVVEDPDPQVLRRRRDGLRHGDLRGPDALDEERQRPGALHRLDHRPRPHRRAGLERLPDVRHDLLAAAARSSRRSSTARSSRRCTSGSRRFGISSTSSRSTAPASPRD